MVTPSSAPTPWGHGIVLEERERLFEFFLRQLFNPAIADRVNLARDLAQETVSRFLATGGVRADGTPIPCPSWRGP